MAQEVKIAGALFENVPKIQVPDSNDVYHPFVDPSVTTATASNVTSGKVFIASDGTETTGTGASTITSTYSNGTVTLNTEDVSVAWWGGLNPVRLHEASYTLTLDQTNYSDLTPSTSNQTLQQPASGYSSSAATYITFDRWGNGYHGGSSLDFANYNYIVLNEAMSNIAYTVAESSMGILHMIQNSFVSVINIGHGFKISSGSVVVPTESVAGTSRVYAMTYSSAVRRSASNALELGSSLVYGVGLTVTNPSLYSTSTLTPFYVNFRSPQWSIRTNTSYHAQGAWAYVDAANTTLTNRQTLYRVDKPGQATAAWDRLLAMWQNKTIPVEVI